MFIDTKNRTEEPEIMDNFAMEGEELRDSLDKIAIFNQVLGGNKVTLHGVKELISSVSKSVKIRIVDVGCGNGDMLRFLADYADQNVLKFELIGIDANNYTINHARKLSVNHPNIVYQCEDIFNEKFKELEYDIVLCTLTLHHFAEEEILKLMKVFYANAKRGIVINDLHRSGLSYRLFQAIGCIFRLKEMPRKDGLTSILRGFKKDELIQFSKKLNFKKYKIRWRWAFRYQWIISKI